VATVADPEGYTLGNGKNGDYFGVFTIDLSTYALNQVGVIMFSRSSKIQNDLPGQLIDNNDGTFRVLSGTWGTGGFGGTLQVQYWTSSSNLLSGTHVVSSATTWTLPSIPNSGGAYNANLIKIISTWYLAYDVTTDTAFISPQVQFYPVLASSPDSAGSPNGTWTLVASDAARSPEEGVKFANIGGTVYITDGSSTSMQLYNSSLSLLGVLKAPAPPTFQNTLPHAALFVSGSSLYNITFDGTPYNSNTFTWGRLHVQKAANLN
jgi:hypothetical protein